MTSNPLEKLTPWFILRSVPGVGNLLFRRLIARFETPEAVLGAGRDALLDIDGISPRIAEAIEGHGITDAVRRELEMLDASGYQVVTFNDAGYPPLLREIPDPPPFLYLHGRLDNVDRTVAIVGTREPTHYGRRASRHFAEALCRRGITVVSGMARGIDTQAHIGAVEAGGKTIAVLGSGFERIYPEENAGLFHKIAENGAVVTEFSLRSGPDPFRFPIRNRVISGLSRGVIVVEAARKSGALITARMAGEQGREVFAVPGNIFSGRSAGVNGLIQQGAKLITSIQDILDEIPDLVDHPAPLNKTSAGEIDFAMPQRSLFPDLVGDEKTVVDALSGTPVHIDELVRKLGIDAARLSGILLQLELKGIIAQLPGKMFALGT